MHNSVTTDEPVLAACVASACPEGCPPFHQGDRYCAFCGRVAAIVTWYIANGKEPSAEPVWLKQDGSFFVIAHNTGTASVKVEISLARTTGLALQGISTRHLGPGAKHAFEITTVPGTSVTGHLIARSYDKPPDPRQWWRRDLCNEQTLVLSEHVRLQGHQDQWVIGSPTILFPPQSRQQVVRIWNDAPEKRTFDAETPSGYRLTSMGVPLSHQGVSIGAHGTSELVFTIDRQYGSMTPDTEWLAEPDAEPVPIIRLPPPKPEAGPVAIVAIDFGTRNTGVRVRWRRTVTSAKPAGTVDVIGDARFPTVMVLNKTDSFFLWGEEAARHVRSALADDQIEVDNLKTHLRKGYDHFTQYSPAYTNEALLTRYFRCIFEKLDEYLKTADPHRPLSRKHPKIQYVLTRPVLDEGQEGTAVRHYEATLRQALTACDVNPEDIAFVSEPEAALVGIEKRRRDELAQLDSGSVVAVVDSGGGTTDVVVAEVNTSEGDLKLRVLGSFAAKSVGNPVAGNARRFLGENGGDKDDEELGGNLLDAALARQLAQQANTLLESIDGRREVPSELQKVTGSSNHEFLTTCRRMKERFVEYEMQFLNRPGDEADPDEILPYPTHTHLTNICLRHELCDTHVMAPLLEPAVARLRAQFTDAGVDPNLVRAVYYVGGTNADPFVRLHFSQLFPATRFVSDPDDQIRERLEERLYAVSEGASWYGESVFVASPVTAAVRLAGQESIVVRAGEALRPHALAPAQFFDAILEPARHLC